VISSRVRARLRVKSANSSLRPLESNGVGSSFRLSGFLQKSTTGRSRPFSFFVSHQRSLLVWKDLIKIPQVLVG